MSRNMLKGMALLATLGMALATPGEAHARRCRNGRYSGASYSYGYSNSGSNYTYNSANTNSGMTYAPGSPCAGTAPATNPDGTIAPQPANQPPQAAPAPPPAPAPAPPSA